MPIIDGQKQIIQNHQRAQNPLDSFQIELSIRAVYYLL